MGWVKQLKKMEKKRKKKGKFGSGVMAETEAEILAFFLKLKSD